MTRFFKVQIDTRYIHIYIHTYIYASCLDTVARLFMLEYRPADLIIMSMYRVPCRIFSWEGEIVDVCKGCVHVSVDLLGFCSF